MSEEDSKAVTKVIRDRIATVWKNREKRVKERQEKEKQDGKVEEDKDGKGKMLWAIKATR